MGVGIETGADGGGDKTASREVLRLREEESLSRSEAGVPGREIANTVEARRITPPIREDHFVGLGLGLLIAD
jgi:hypothetical protein